MTIPLALEDRFRRHLHDVTGAVVPSPSGLSRIRAGVTARAHKPRTCPRREGKRHA